MGAVHAVSEHDFCERVLVGGYVGDWFGDLAAVDLRRGGGDRVWTGLLELGAHVDEHRLLIVVVGDSSEQYVAAIGGGDGGEWWSVDGESGDVDRESYPDVVLPMGTLPGVWWLQRHQCSDVAHLRSAVRGRRLHGSGGGDRVQLGRSRDRGEQADSRSNTSRGRNHHHHHHHHADDSDDVHDDPDDADHHDGHDADDDHRYGHDADDRDGDVADDSDVGYDVDVGHGVDVDCHVRGFVNDDHGGRGHVDADDVHHRARDGVDAGVVHQWECSDVRWICAGSQALVDGVASVALEGARAGRDDHGSA
jgi:hypothetical protein